MKLLVDACVFIDAFDPNSPNHKVSSLLLEALKGYGVTVVMPAHGWFEVQCTFQRLQKEGRFVGSPIAGDSSYPIELIHIDDNFIKKYAMADVPYIKAGDHIYLAIAKISDCSITTSDEGMRRVGLTGGIEVLSPTEALGELLHTGA